jgi:anti-sigma factor RsiW
MRSHLATKRLSAYLDDELPERELRLVEAHVSACATCRSRLHGLRLVVSDLHRMPAVEPPPSSARSVELEAALRWGPPPRWTHRPFGQRGIELLRNLIQLSAMTAGAIAIIAMLVAWNAARERGANERSPAAVAPEQVERLPAEDVVGPPAPTIDGARYRDAGSIATTR